MMAVEFAIAEDATVSERSASRCPECDTEAGGRHDDHCPLRPYFHYEDFLAERYARGDASVFRLPGGFAKREEYLESHQ